MSPPRSAAECDSDRVVELFKRADQQWEKGELVSAFRLFLAAAKLGDLSCQHNLGYFYDRGLAVKANRAKALYWYKRAYRRGAATSATNIGTIWRDEKNKVRALYWFKRAVKLGDAEAGLEIAKLYLADRKESRKAIPYLKMVCRSEHVTQSGMAEARRLLRRALSQQPED